MADPRYLAYVALGELLPAERNAKGHDAPLIEASVSRFGFVEPIIMDERTGRLVAGHGRLAELERGEAAGEERPDGIGANDDGKWLAPVVRGWSSKDDAEALAVGIALNRGTERGGWQYEELFDQLSELTGGELGLLGIGFADEELDDVLARAQEEIVEYDPNPDWAGHEGAHAEPSMDERTQQYARKGIRSLVLDYATNEFDELVATASRLRRERGVETNAELVGLLIREAAARELGKVVEATASDAPADA